MNSKTLEKHYDKLNIRERAALVINAFSRNDEGEVARLIGAAPHVTLDAPDCGRAVQSYGLLIAYHAVCCLEVCGMFFFLAHFEDKKRGKLNIKDALAIITWDILARAEAWKKVCAELGLDPIGALKICGLPQESAGAALMETAEKIARAIAPTLEEAQGALKRYVGKEHRLRTAETIAAEYLAVLNPPTRSR